MYKERTMEFYDLKGKTHFTISSNDNKVDFKSEKTRVTIYYDDSNDNRDEFFAE